MVIERINKWALKTDTLCLSCLRRGCIWANYFFYCPGTQILNESMFWASKT